MNLPNMLNAKVRGKSRVDVLYDDYNTCEIDNIGNDKNPPEYKSMDGEDLE